MTPIIKLINDINSIKVIKNFAGRFGDGVDQVNIQNLNADALSQLTIELYNKVLFLGSYYKDIPNFSGQQKKYQVYFNALFSQLQSISREIGRRNENHMMDLPIKSCNFTEGVRAGIVRIDPAVLPDQTPAGVLEQILNLGIDGDKKTAVDYKASQEFKAYYEDKKRQLEDKFQQKKIVYYTLKLPMDLGIKFSRGDGENANLKKQSKKLAEGFNPKKNWWQRNQPNFLKTREQILYESITKFIKKNLGANIENTIYGKTEQAAKKALFSLKDSTLYTKIKNGVPDHDPGLTAQEKLLFQRRLIKFLQYEIDGVDPFEPPYKQFAKFMERHGSKGIIGLFALGIIPPFSVFFAPSAEDFFENSVLKYLLKASYWITYPLRVVLEYGVVIPLEAPLKVVEAAKKAIFYSDEFAENQNIFERFAKSLGDQKFGEMRSFHRGYNEEMIAVNGQTGKFQNKVNLTATVDIDGVPKDVVQNTRHSIKFANQIKAKRVAKKDSADAFMRNF